MASGEERTDGKIRNVKKIKLERASASEIATSLGISPGEKKKAAHAISAVAFHKLSRRKAPSKSAGRTVAKAHKSVGA